jgi:predicted nucleic acid-binding protein
VANSFYLDASALAKRYVPEAGTPEVNAIFDAVPGNRLRVLNIGLGEIVFAMVRKRNAGTISQAYLEQALLDFDAEIVRGEGVTRDSVTSRLVARSFRLIVAHSINSADALVIESALAIARRLRRAGGDLVLVASDQRLLRAAQAEGLIAFDPESQDAAALTALIGP